ncbi:CLUMA_CG006204, isoform A [Clunio marinus]|uniref:CLUMA_CG006204, isoform A n=1 Tax=Clunio marinus TaxID=568069 RepID=A0A1J1HYL4_9DIPT|nr:CLUMA_CG006204, isoform A [Clunio marinus]
MKGKVSEYLFEKSNFNFQMRGNNKQLSLRSNSIFRTDTISGYARGNGTKIKSRKAQRMKLKKNQKKCNIKVEAKLLQQTINLISHEIPN